MKIEFFAAYFIQLTHAMMCFIHLLAYSFIIAFFQGVANVEYALNLFDDIFDPQGYRLVLVDSVVKHELASSAYNKRRQSCEAAVAAVQKKHPHVEFLRVEWEILIFQ